MPKSIWKHALFILLLAILITAYTLYAVYMPGSAYSFVFALGYLVLIILLINSFYIKKNSGMGFVLFVGMFSLLCFIPLVYVFTLFGTDALGKFLVSMCTILFLLNIFYIIFQVGRKEIKISLIPYTSLLVMSILMQSLAYTHWYNLMCSQGT